ncbi:DELTA-sagatoxin-Srs1a [Merluccius polli]|uniref:DELTA-sagatoxin-Srs1a n=1 Tax=Merluccius polli TaxID=89951 RepID=A0AA47NQC4_MERPO|nr:DELTA-sagatoxin-Srs1a [Merluccius polli]
MHIVSGRVDTPLPSVIEVATTGRAVFTKTTGTATGAVGVFTYDLVNSGSETLCKIAVMFSVPFDFDFYDNLFAVGVFESNVECDYELYDLMYYKPQRGFLRDLALHDHRKFKHGDIVIEASMTNTATPHLKVTVKQEHTSQVGEM